MTKLVTFRVGGGGERVGVLRADEGVVEVAAAGAGGIASMVGLIEGGDAARAAGVAAAGRAPRDAVQTPGSYRLCAPIPVPPQMRDFMVFERHVEQSTLAALRLREARGGEPAPASIRLPEVWYRQPLYYKCNRFAVSGPDDEILWPDYSQLMDYELELACIVGRRGRDIPAARAREHIFGYTIFNDLSARDAQAIEMEARLGPAKGKDFDGANVLGPCIVTRDELDDPYRLEMIARVNGEERSRGSSSTMHWTFEQMIEHVSRGETLHPGEILGSGTVGGGCGLETLRFLESGDVIELEIERIGVLRNRIVRRPAAGETPT
jgi:2-keto-4-pentenoate hydratase/2-oxohepta-3-ene-1,7-dioic acid hydratase in catechol pathway